MKYTSVFVLAALLSNASAVHMQLSKKGEGEGETAANATVTANATVAANTTAAANTTEAATAKTDASLPKEPEWAAPLRAKKAEQDARLEEASIDAWVKKRDADKEYHKNHSAKIEASREEIKASPMPEIEPFKIPGHNSVSYDGVSKAMSAGNNTNSTTPAEIEKAVEANATKAADAAPKEANASNATSATNSTAAPAATKAATDTVAAATPPAAEAAPAATPAADAAPAATPAGDAAAAAQKSTPKLAQAPGMAIPVKKIPSQQTSQKDVKKEIEHVAAKNPVKNATVLTQAHIQSVFKKQN